MVIIIEKAKTSQKEFHQSCSCPFGVGALLFCMSSDFSIDLVRWETHAEPLGDVRYRVFVVEQKVPEEIEVDSIDPLAIHALARDLEGNPIGTGRLARDGRIGRVAVLHEWRGKSVGTELMRRLIDHARSIDLKAVYLHGQSRSLEFYEKLGFVAQGPEFLEADIAHRQMTLSL